MNRQQVIPLLQTLGLPIYWLVGHRLFGLAPAAATVFMVAAPFIVHTAVVGLGFMVSWANQHEDRRFRHGPRRDWLLAFAGEACESIRQFYWLMPFREGFRVPEPVGPVRQPPIVLIHGYGCNRGLWLPAARWFSRRGYRVSAISLHPQHCPIEQYADAIAEAVVRADADSGGAGVALICHSMGGLAGRAYLRQCAERHQDPRLAALITLGSPHSGTHLARVGLGENARQMRYRAPWLDELDRFDPHPGAAAAGVGRPVCIATVTSIHDNIVSRPLEQRLRLPGARAIFVRRQGHMSIATSPRIFRIIDRILQRRQSRATLPAVEPLPETAS